MSHKHKITRLARKQCRGYYKKICIMQLFFYMHVQIGQDPSPPALANWIPSDNKNKKKYLHRFSSTQNTIKDHKKEWQHEHGQYNYWMLIINWLLAKKVVQSYLHMHIEKQLHYTISGIVDHHFQFFFLNDFGYYHLLATGKNVFLKWKPFFLTIHPI
jgi:hypothetical protein